MPLIPLLGRQRQTDLYEFEVSLVYRVEFQDSQDCYIEKPCLEIPKPKLIICLLYAVHLCIQPFMYSVQCSRSTTVHVTPVS